MKKNVIGLLTDFGTKDYFVGAMKGAILSINEDAKIVDITHEIPPQDIQSAGWILNACYRDFPQKTVFVAVVDPGVGSDRRAILVETKNYYFIAPDNGLLSFIFNEEKYFRVFELTHEGFFRNPISNTFHGRDIFSPCAAHLSNGVKSEKFGKEIKDFIFQEISNPKNLGENSIEAEIIHIDHFGNLITNLKKENLPKKFTLEIKKRKIKKLQEYFAEAEKSELFMILGSAGYLEIVAFQDSASILLKAGVGNKVLIRY